MLLAALGATIVGFVLLIVALVTGNLWLAIACVVVSVIGVVLLLIDVLTYRRADRDKSVAQRLGDDEAPAWSPGDADADEAAATDPGDVSANDPPAVASASGVVADPAVTTGDDVADTEITQVVPRIAGGDDDAAREAATVGHEEFGHHDVAADDDSEPPTGKFSIGGQQWSHESAADTDDDSTRGLFAPGRYDPDMTDQIPQIEVERAWGAEWEPPEEPGTK
ncbi:Transmembrane protein OS=Tsukamurella paurometabola (strain ATCC 8368 / DSM / CCUG 35730 / CIP 100753 / JCM 10117 / KCTC 9821 / NBRC 16120 / NCIMB 702349/ NCTC 13040) OX=521096 GN=Tpau_2637 PE=4 SV=1 [Tsukamurella paurometabola]|uniref:Transmembrane protein n=1 Tax=Tsukamurella paurometabola (strain ATCC 8368 / DSM 20162 / CCUG 35730 / CIP 100753 / JCM 10117 / KCTC 9821 / NBRC 16120 / NCIMB 702349 / NCTC 13040) TaxID=521096 RepID=D5USG6_TSUPD|nr:hypothetical protein [Tsukamurella paurometabola]ADG79237.1 hypothetical protein Tpau_2637 [Tsukamurella paurometabola DSM 20162]SUP34703.1 Uncharacterised protein [Tsukamurella paurometabola]